MKKLLLIIGAPKCGTTSLANWLNLSEAFCLHPRKEPGHFRSGVRSFILGARIKDMISLPTLSDDEYISQFSHHDRYSWLVDASTDYLSDQNSPHLVSEFSNKNCINVKVIAVLRDPIVRAHSEYLHTIRDGLEIASFQESLRLEKDRILRDYQPLFFHAKRSMYYDDLQRWRSSFDNNFLILTFSDLRYPARIASKLRIFLGQDFPEIRTMPHTNKSVTESRLPGTFPLTSRAIKYLRCVAPSPTDLLERNISRRLWCHFDLTESDKEAIFERLRPDLEKCFADPGIPTDDWEVSRSLFQP